jgi:hypothetical protein
MEGRTYQASRDAVLIATSLTSPLVLDFASRHDVARDVRKTGSKPLLITRCTDSKRHRHARND